jgi:predicted nucleic acid-binding protein
VIKRVFLDSDILLDVAVAREPFVEKSRIVLASIEKGRVIGHVSPNIITNVYYILRKIGSNGKAKDFLRTLLKFIGVIAVDHAAVMRALESDFIDFEDAVQHYSALSGGCDYLVTRNTEDYRESEIPVLNPAEYIALFLGAE